MTLSYFQCTWPPFKTATQVSRLLKHSRAHISHEIRYRTRRAIFGPAPSGKRRCPCTAPQEQLRPTHGGELADRQDGSFFILRSNCSEDDERWIVMVTCARNAITADAQSRYSALTVTLAAPNYQWVIVFTIYLLIYSNTDNPNVQSGMHDVRNRKACKW